MLKLILKDFAVQKNSFKTYVAIALALGVFFLLNGWQQMAVFMISAQIIYSFLNHAFYEDEKNNTLRLLVSLPVQREKLVYARYITLAIVTVGTFALFTLVYYVLVLSGVLKEELGTGIVSFFIIILFFIILVSVYLPLAYKLGYIKANSINRFFLIGIFAVSTAAGLVLKNISESSPPAFISRISEILSSVNPYTMLIFAIAFTASIYLVSMELSIKYFRRRNLF